MTDWQEAIYEVVQRLAVIETKVQLIMWGVGALGSLIILSLMTRIGVYLKNNKKK